MAGFNIDVAGERLTEDERTAIWGHSERTNHYSEATSLVLLVMCTLKNEEQRRVVAVLDPVAAADFDLLVPWFAFDSDEDDPEVERHWREPAALEAAVRRLAEAFRRRTEGSVMLWRKAEDDYGAMRDDDDAGRLITRATEERDGHASGDWQAHCAIHFERLANYVAAQAKAGERRLRLDLIAV